MIAFLRDLVCKDFGLKLFSLALAGLVYFTVYYAKTDRGAPLWVKPAKERILADVPVEIICATGTVPDFKVEPRMVEITVQGDPAVIEGLETEDVRVLVDLTGMASVREVRKRLEVSLPAGVTYLRVRPEEIRAVAPPETSTVQRP